MFPQIERKRRTFLPELTPVSSGCAGRFSWKNIFNCCWWRREVWKDFLSVQFEVKVLLRLIYSWTVSLWCQSGCDSLSEFLVGRISSFRGSFTACLLNFKKPKDITAFWFWSNTAVLVKFVLDIGNSSGWRSLDLLAFFQIGHWWRPWGVLESWEGPTSN